MTATRKRPRALLAGLVLASAGLALAGTETLAEVRSRPALSGRAGDVFVELERAAYVHHPEDDGASPFPMPPGMMPGMPPEGLVRLGAELTLRNEGAIPVRHEAAHLEVRSAKGGSFPAVLADATHAVLAPGESLVTVVSFDVPEGEPDVRLVLARGGPEVALAIPPAPEHQRPRRVDWPPSVADLPAGDPAEGAKLYAGRLACFTCHGDPRAPGTETLGPGLGAVAAAASRRVAGKGAAQYLYESILDPDAFVPETCAHGAACAQPSQMPRYGSSLGKDELSDLLAFLLEQRG